MNYSFGLTISLFNRANFSRVMSFTKATTLENIFRLKRSQ
jgi:hypothetical protein